MIPKFTVYKLPENAEFGPPNKRQIFHKRDRSTQITAERTREHPPAQSPLERPDLDHNGSKGR